MDTTFAKLLGPTCADTFASLTTPFKIQEFLDTVVYSSDPFNRTPLQVLQERTGNCMDGGLLGAAALQEIGYPPLIIDLLPEPGTDDDHILAIYKKNNCYGAVAKSNFVGLRSREPVYKTLRELVMSYFDVFFNLDGLKTLRGYTRPLNLNTFESDHWQWNEQTLDKICNRLDQMKVLPVISEKARMDLMLMDQRTKEANMIGINYAGLFKPGSH